LKSGLRPFDIRFGVDTLKENKSIEPPKTWSDVVIAKSYKNLLHPQILQAEMVSVPALDCDDCRWVKEGRTLPGMRCCSVTPPFPNFLVGEWLTQGGHDVLDMWLSQRRGDPYGISVPPAVRHKHEEARQDGGLGLPCSLVDGKTGRCTVYTVRPAICMGFHCLYPHVLWREWWGCFYALLELWQETAVLFIMASYASEGLAERMTKLDRGDCWTQTGYNEESYSHLWGEWLGHERHFYRGCFSVIEDIDDVTRELLLLFQQELLLGLLDEAGVLDAQRRELLEAIPSLELEPCPPPEEVRGVYRSGRFVYTDNRHTLTEHASFWLWYHQQIAMLT
tara:strand:- start:2225 stop:3232 length:1008 start_codon:yes stop_codon:yes gene_type:complete